MRVHIRLRWVFSGSLITQLQTAACRRLIRREFSPHEFPFLIDAILKNKSEYNTMCRLGEADAQTFIDVLEEVRSAFTRRHESIDRNRNQHSVGQALRIPGFSPVTNKGWLILL